MRGDLNTLTFNLHTLICAIKSYTFIVSCFSRLNIRVYKLKVRVCQSTPYIYNHCIVVRLTLSWLCNEEDGASALQRGLLVLVRVIVL